MKKYLAIPLLLLIATAFTMPLMAADKRVSITAEYKTVVGQLFLRQTAGGSALFKANGTDYDVWLPSVPELATISNGTTVALEGVFTTNTINALEAPVVHPYKITIKGRVIDLSQSFGWNGQGAYTGMGAGAGADALTAASTGRGPAARSAPTARYGTTDYGRRDHREEWGRERDYDDD